jgi:hypothetical protein
LEYWWAESEMASRKSTKKKITIWGALIISFAFLSRMAFSGEREIFKRKLSINLTGGYCSMNVGDINSYLKSFDNYLRETTTYEGGKTKVIHYIPDLEGEVRFDISSRFAISIGIGQTHGKKESAFQYIEVAPFDPNAKWLHSYYIIQKVSVLPLKLGSYYSLPLISRINLFLNGGLGYYFSKCSLLIESHVDPGIPEPTSVTYDLSSRGFGLYGGFGFEFKIINFLTLGLEIQGRYAKIKNLEGSSWYGPEKAEGTLYIGEVYSTTYKIYSPCLIISSSEPSGDEFRNIRKAELNLSGYSLRACIRIRPF